MFLRLLLIFSMFIGLTSCGGDVKVTLPPIDKLSDGRYVVVGAKRSGRVTETLNGGFYEIQKDSVFTNLSQTMDSIGTTYTLTNNEIKHKSANALNFIVSKMTSDSLELNTELAGFDFELYLVKDSSLENQD